MSNGNSRSISGFTRQQGIGGLQGFPPPPPEGTTTNKLTVPLCETPQPLAVIVSVNVPVGVVDAVLTVTVEVPNVAPAVTL
jgi:hypothetical protein